MRKTPPSTIPLDYDYQLRMLPSSSTAANFYDNQTTSLFGDPVPPPPEEFLESIDSHLYGSLRRSSIVRDFPKANSFAPVVSDVASSMQGPSDQGRLRSPAPLESRRIFPREPQTHSHLRPEIRVLPGSDSSSDSRISPTIDVTDRKMDSRGPVEVDRDILYYQQHHRWDTSSRISTEFGERFQDSGERKQHEPETRMRSIFSSVPVRYSRQISNESVSSSEWFKPTNNYQEWTRIPRLRPSSKNVISIKHSQQTHQDSSVATLINDSNGSSSSSEEKLPIEHEKLQDVSVKVRHKPNQKAETDRLMSAEMKQPTGLPPAVPKRDVSPVILTNAITTGADYRVSPPRPHKKTSFTIMAEKSPQSSRAQSPHNMSGGRISPFFGRGFKEPPRPSSQPVPTAARLKLPAIYSASNIITSDDSPRPSVQFNMSSFSGRDSPSKAQSKGILQNKPGRPLSRDEGGKPLAPNQKVRSFDALPRISGPDGGAIPRPPSRRLNKSALDLYNVKKGEAPRSSINPNPTSRQRGLLRVINSADNSPSRIPVRTSLNASMDDLMLKRRSSLSPTRLDKAGALTPLETEPRSSIVSLNSDRRSSNLSSVTTSDFSFRRPSNSSIQPTIGGRRQSIYQSTVSNAAKSRFGSVKKRPIARKVAKPTTLSPIIGTPNREGPSSSEDVESINQNGKLGVGSKIPIREGINILSCPNSIVSSRANSRTNSRAPSVINSRSNSPIKDHFLSQPSSRINSRSPSRATSRPPSRQTSRPVSRSSSRQESRIQSRSNSRSNSRLSQRGINAPKGKFSSLPKNRRASPNKSKSPSPKKTRRKSLSPPKSVKAVGGDNKQRGRKSTIDKPASRKGSPSKQANLKRNSPKRSNSRKDPVSAKKPSSDSEKNETGVRRTPLAAKKSISPKRQNSNLKRSTSNLKQEVLKREASSIKKTSSSSSLKREPSNVTKSTIGLKREQSSIKGGAASIAKKDPPTTKTGVAAKKGPSKRTAYNLDKKLEKKNSFRKEKQALGSSGANSGNDGNQLRMEVDSNGKLVPLTKQSVVSMTTAAIAAQPAQITTAVTNQISLNKTNSSGQLINTENPSANPGDLMSDDVKDILPAAILERSTKTLETIQKTVTEAHEEIQKTINENLTDLKTLESDIGKLGEDISKHNPFEKSDSVQTVIEIPTADRGQDHDGAAENSSQPPKSPVPPTQPIEAEVSVVNAKASSDKLLHPNVNHNNNNNDSPSSSPGPLSESGKNLNPSEDMAERVSERAISVLPEVECESANLQNYEEDGLEDSEDKPVYATKDEHPMHMQSGEEVLGQTVEDSENNNDGGNKG